MFCPSWVNKFVITVAHALTVGPSGIIACVLLWEYPRRLGVYLLLAHETRRQSHHKVVSRPTPKSNNGIPNGASFNTTVTIELWFALLNVKCFDAIRLGQSSKSAIVEHVHEQSMLHEIDWEGMKAIDYARWKRERKINEAFHIQKPKPELNRDGGVERSAEWA